jgi:hypothetical protein
MIAGVYVPDYNGAINQCKQLVLELSDIVKFEILFGTNQMKECYLINVDCF